METKDLVYGIYDMKNNEQCIGIFSNVTSVALYLNKKRELVSSAITRENWIKARYLVKRIDLKEE